MEEFVESPRDELEVRIFTLCDHAAATPDGKLYIHGAGVHQMYLPQIPGQLSRLFVVARLSIPWQMLGEQHVLSIRCLDLDRKPVGQVDPLIAAPFELGRPPGFRPGDESAMNVVADIGSVIVQEAMTVRFHLVVDGRALTSLPLKIQQIPPLTAAVLG